MNKMDEKTVYYREACSYEIQKSYSTIAMMVG
jgi:hypothetical protein